METEAPKIEETKINYTKAKQKEIVYILIGFAVLLIWITLFIVGMFVDSSYYRIAISYGFFDWKDIALTIFSFTVSNVVFLAFLAALLGGICSLIIYTEGFTLTKNQLKERNISNILYENPFISAFRGVFLFFAILSIQYVSSFSDMSLLGNDAGSDQKKEEVRDNRIYSEIIKSIHDSTLISRVQEIINKEQVEVTKNSTDFLTESIIRYKDTLLQLEESKLKDVSIKRELIENKIKATLKKMKVDKKDELPGISTASYFKFAIIVSLLSFLCGYDPNKFNSFLSSVPFIKGQNNNENNTPPNK